MKPTFCSECGSTLNENGTCSNSACPKYSAAKSAPASNKASSFQTPKANSASISAKLSELKSFPELGKQIVPDCINSDVDEVPIRQYDIARPQTLIKGAFAEGRLQITNKRVLFRAVGNSLLGRTSLQYEFSLEEIAGIEIRKEARFNFFTSLLLVLLTFLINNILQPIVTPVYSWGFFSKIFTIILLVGSVIAFFACRNHRVLRHLIMSVFLAGIIPATDIIKLMTSGSLESTAYPIILILYVISLIYLAFAPNLVVNIKTKGGSPSVEIRKKDGLFSFHHNDYTGFAQVLPGPDTDKAMTEIGALIREVQQTGTYSE